MRPSPTWPASRTITTTGYYTSIAFTQRLAEAGIDAWNEPHQHFTWTKTPPTRHSPKPDQVKDHRSRATRV